MPLKVHFLNVGRGDCTIVEFPSGRVGIIDIYNLKVLDEDTRKELVKEFSESREYQQAFFSGHSGMALATKEEAFIKEAQERLTDPLNYYDTYIGATENVFRFIATHPDMDHLTGLYRLYEQEYGKGIVNFWYPSYEVFNLDEATNWKGSPYDELDWETYRKLRDSANSPKSFKQGQGATGDYWTNDGIEIWAPTPTLESMAVEKNQPNIVSMILKISYQGRSILLGGDATGDETWSEIWPYVNMEGIDVLKASHHGRKSGYFGKAVKEMSPWLTITSVANDRKHDATQNYRRYSDYTVSLRKSGDIRITIEDDGTLLYSPNIEEHWKPKKT